MAGSSPRRSPRLKGLSPAPEGPGPKPRPPRRVNDPAEDSVRQAVHAAALAAWEEASKVHADLMKVRHRAKTAAWKAARKKSAADKDAPPPAALAPPPLTTEEMELASDYAAAAVPQPVEQKQEEVRFKHLRRDTARWLLDVEAIASRCGAGQAQLLDVQGRWFDPAQHGGVPGPIPHPA